MNSMILVDNKLRILIGVIFTGFIYIMFLWGYRYYYDYTYYKETTINTDGAIIFNKFKLDKDSQKVPLNKVINGTILNQFWITSPTLSNDELLRIISKYNKLNVRAIRESGRIMVEVRDEADGITIEQLNLIKGEKSIRVYNNKFTGQDHYRSFFY